jgi:hypothetical protein
LLSLLGHGWELAASGARCKSEGSHAPPPFQ